MARQRRACCDDLLLARDLSFVPNTHFIFTTDCNSNSKGSSPLFWTLGILALTHAYTYIHTYT